MRCGDDFSLMDERGVHDGDGGFYCGFDFGQVTGEGEEGFAAEAAGELHFGDADVGGLGGGVGGVEGGGDGGGFDDGQGFDVRAGAGFAAEGRPKLGVGLLEDEAIDEAVGGDV